MLDRNGWRYWKMKPAGFGPAAFCLRCRKGGTDAISYYHYTPHRIFVQEEGVAMVKCNECGIVGVRFPDERLGESSVKIGIVVAPHSRWNWHCDLAYGSNSVLPP